MPGAVGTCLDYLVFLHDRLVVRVPGILGVTLTRRLPTGEFAGELRTTRLDVDTHHFDLEWTASTVESGEDPSHAFVVTRPANGTSLRFEVPAELVLGSEMERRIRLYGLVVLAGLQVDNGSGSGLPLDSGSGRLAHSTRSGSHLERVAGYSHIVVCALSEPLGLTPDFADAVFRYAPLHDVGQVVFPAAMMQKPGRLDPDEWELMKSHTLRGRMIVDVMIENADPHVVPRSEVLRNVVELHHESLDGRGYPNGLSGDDVPLEARIVMVADVFDALVSKRPYKAGWSTEEALTEMDRMVDDGRIDGRCLTALVTLPEVVEAVAASGAEPPRMMRA